MQFLNADFSRIAGILFCILLLPTSSLAQEKVRKTETISTTSKLIVAKFKATAVKGTTVFTLAVAHNDGTLTGNLVYTLPDVERQKIAQSLNTSLAAIPANFAANNLIARFEKNTHCPDIHLAFAELDLELSGIKLHLNHFVLSLTETPQKLSRALCIWTDRTNKGVVNTGIVQYINLLLKGEEDEPQPK